MKPVTTSCARVISALCSFTNSCSASFINVTARFSSLTLLSDSASSDSHSDSLHQHSLHQHSQHTAHIANTQPHSQHTANTQPTHSHTANTQTHSQHTASTSNNSLVKYDLLVRHDPRPFHTAATQHSSLLCYFSGRWCHLQFFLTSLIL